MKFHKSASGYYAYGAQHAYYVDRPRDAGRAWTLRIFTLESVAGITVSDELIKTAMFAEKREATSVARAYESLGPDYRSSEHGHAERYTVAVNRGLATL